MSQTEPRVRAEDDLTVLSRKTAIRGGAVSVAHDLTVRGVIEGDVDVGGRVVVAAGARIAGTLRAREATVAGRVEGDVRVTETLTLRSTAVIDGLARAARLVVEEGSTGRVKLQIGDRAFFNGLEARRSEARAELGRVRSRTREVRNQGARNEGNSLDRDGSENSGDGGMTEAARPADAEGPSTSELMHSREMGDFLGSGPPTNPTTVEDEARTAE